MAGELPSWFTLESVRVFEEQGGTLYVLDYPDVVAPVPAEFPQIVGSSQVATNIPRLIFPASAVRSSASDPTMTAASGEPFDWRIGLIIAGLAWLLLRK